MSKIFIPYPSEEYVSRYLEQDFDGFIVGIEKFSSNFNNLVSVEGIKDIVTECKEYNKKVFISFDRLYYNDEIDDVKNTILKLNNMDIDGICYTDIGVLNILNSIDFKGDIFWNSNHLGTNRSTVNFLEKRGVNYALLSTEISIDEIISIKKNTNINIGVALYGFLNMTTSSRKLLTNYFEYTNKDKKDNKYYIKDKVKNEKYQLIEDINTNFYTGKVLNGIKYFPILIDNNIDFIYLDNYLLDENKFYNIIEAFSSLRNAPKDKEFVSKLEEVVNINTDFEVFDGFLNKETVYKVKDYE